MVQVEKAKKTAPKNPEPRTAQIRISKRTLAVIASAGKPYGFSAQRSFNLIMSNIFPDNTELAAANASARLKSEVQAMMEEAGHE